MCGGIDPKGLTALVVVSFGLSVFVGWSLVNVVEWLWVVLSR